MAWVDFGVSRWAWGLLGFTVALWAGCTPGLADDQPLGATGDATGTSAQTTATSDDRESSSSTEATATTGSTTPPPPCDTWCGGYPSAPGCDEDDEGINAEGTDDDSSFEDGASGGGDESGLGMGDDIPLATEIYAVR